MPLTTLPKKGQRKNIIYVSLRYSSKSCGEKKAFSSFLFRCSLRSLGQYADQQKMSVICQKCVMVNLVFALMIDSESMASPAKMGRATA